MEKLKKTYKNNIVSLSHRLFDLILHLTFPDSKLIRIFDFET